MDEMLKINKLSFAFNKGQPLIENFSAQLRRGQIALLKAPNGKGKTTLFRLLIGELVPESGKIQATGKIALMEQKLPNLFFIKSLSVYDALEVLRSRSSVEKNKLVKEYWITLRLENLKNYQLYQLSGGQLRRVMMARMALSDADILLLDEPTANVDYQSVQMIENLWAKLVENGKSIIFSSHAKHWKKNHLIWNL